MKPFVFKYKEISDYRSELMGWSILWIMMLHFTFTQIKPLGFIAQYGFAGVDIFFFVSGFGLYYSLDNNSNLLQYYRKRVLRIFPTYYLLGVLDCFFINHDNLCTFLFRYSTIGFWTNGIYGDWFIPSIIILYIIAPFIKKLLDKKLYITIGTLILCIILLSLYLVDKDKIIDRSHYFLLYRIPAFIFGMICANWKKTGINKHFYLYITIIGILLFIVFYPNHHKIYNFKYYSLGFLLPAFLWCFIYMTKYLNFLSRYLKRIGEASLEIYLIQGIFFAAILQNLIIINPQLHDIYTLLFMSISIIGGIITHMLIKKCTTTISDIVSNSNGNTPV